MNIPSLSFSSEQGSKEEIFNFWKEAVKGYFNAIPTEPPQYTHIKQYCKQYFLDDFIFSDLNAISQRFVRDDRMVRRSDDTDHLIIHSFVMGRSEITCGGRNYKERNNLSVINLAHEVDAFSSSSHMRVLILPRAMLDKDLQLLKDYRGHLFEPNSIAEKLFKDFMQSLEKHLDSANVEEIPIIRETMISYLQTMLKNSSAYDSQDTSSVLINSIKAEIDLQIANFDLDADMLARRFHISKATLSRLFKEEGGVASYIRTRRLYGVHRALSNTNYADRSVYDLALDYGLTNPSHLSTLFKKEFGKSPKEYREEQRTIVEPYENVFIPDTSTFEKAKQMYEWSKRLKNSTPH